LVAQLLASKGYEVVPAPEVSGALEAAHLLPASDLPPEAAEQLRGQLRAEAVVTVTISFFLEAEQRAIGPKANPAFGLRVRLLASSGKVWRNSLGWIADEVATPGGGFRKAQPKATALAVERLLWSMPRGRPDPNAVAPVVAEEISAPAPVLTTRFEAPAERQSDFPAVAHFPMRMDSAAAH
jgi:hypothetical protein